MADYSVTAAHFAVSPVLKARRLIRAGELLFVCACCFIFKPSQPFIRFLHLCGLWELTRTNIKIIFFYRAILKGEVILRLHSVFLLCYCEEEE